MAKYSTQFCKEIIDLLSTLNYKVTVYNSLEFIDKTKTFSELVRIWDNHIYKNNNIPYLAIGQAFGGSLLIGLLAKAYKNIKKTVLISAPIKVNKRLYEALNDIINAHNNEGLQEGVNMLEKLVLPINKCFNNQIGKHIPDSKEIYKTILAYRMLQTVDLSNIITDYDRPILNIYGASSQQLVNIDNIILSDKYNKQLAVGISGCGMRPLKENTDLSLKLIKNFINDN
ncbi:MAG: hypothetical protein ACQPRJ_02100 [Solitalea-like symbiont of Acarus siro]